jgi:hypothetical protein
MAFYYVTLLEKILTTHLFEVRPTSLGIPGFQTTIQISKHEVTYIYRKLVKD